MISSAAPSSNAFHLLTDNDHSRVESACFNTLQVFLAPGQITQLVALQVREPGQRCPRDVAGFFDYEHIEQMARTAAEFSGISKGVHFTLNPLKPDVLSRSPNRVQRTQSGILACNNDVSRRSWLMIDLDPARPAGTSATDAEKLLAHEMLNAVSCFLSTCRFPSPIIGDSGNGYHLYYRTELPSDSQLPHRILKLLNEEFSTEAVKIDTTVAKASQLTKLFGTLAAKGPETSDRPHRLSALTWLPNVTTVSEVTLSGVFIPSVAPSTPSVRPLLATPPTTELQTVIERARRYIAKMPPSISGEHGHDRLFEASCRLVKGFGLSIDAALPVLREYNLRAIPPWLEEDLKRKLEQAAARSDPRPIGYLLQAESRLAESPVASSRFAPTDDTSSSVLPGPIFPASVPDFVPVPTSLVREYLEHRYIEPSRGRPKLASFELGLWLAHYALFEKGTLPVWIPDSIMSAGIGGAFPKKSSEDRLLLLNGEKRLTVEAERRRIRQYRKELLELIPLLQRLVDQGPDAEDDALVDRAWAIINPLNELVRQIPQEICPPQCLMHDSGIPHQHYILRLNDAHWRELGEFEVLASDGQRIFDFNKKLDGESKTVLDKLVRSNKVYRAYLPVQLFGQAAGLNIRQIRLIQGLMCEQTRTMPKAEGRVGKSRVEVIRNSCVRAVRQDATIQCPFLDLNETYIAFGGNFKSLRGRGYRLVGNFHHDTHRQGGWLRRFGYEVQCDTDEERLWKWVRIMLADLSELGSSLGLVAAAVDANGRWHPVEVLREMVKEARFRSWLKTCSLRIFAPANYLVRWRHWFAGRLGYSYIPGGDWSAPPDATCPTYKPTPETIRARLKAAGIEFKRLAIHLGWKESRVSRQLSGKTRLCPELATAAAKLLNEVTHVELHGT